MRHQGQVRPASWSATTLCGLPRRPGIRCPRCRLSDPIALAPAAVPVGVAGDRVRRSSSGQAALVLGIWCGRSTSETQVATYSRPRRGHGSRSTSAAPTRSSSGAARRPGRGPPHRQSPSAAARTRSAAVVGGKLRIPSRCPRRCSHVRGELPVSVPTTCRSPCGRARATCASRLSAARRDRHDTGDITAESLLRLPRCSARAEQRRRPATSLCATERLELRSRAGGSAPSCRRGATGSTPTARRRAGSAGSRPPTMRRSRSRR